MSGYRGIEPKLTFNTDVHPMNRHQFLWFEHDTGIEVALYAGKNMEISPNDDDSAWMLTYLDFVHPAAFKTKDEAKSVANDFARSVLLYMLKVVGVREEDRSLRECLSMNGM